MNKNVIKYNNIEYFRINDNCWVLNKVNIKYNILLPPIKVNNKLNKILESFYLREEKLNRILNGRRL